MVLPPIPAQCWRLLMLRTCSIIKTTNEGTEQWEQSMKKFKMFPPLNVCHLNSLKTLPIIVCIFKARKVLSHHNNSAAHRKGLFCTFIDEFMSLRVSVTSFGEVSSKFMPWDTSLLCTHQILQKTMSWDKVLDSGSLDLQFNVGCDQRQRQAL